MPKLPHVSIMCRIPEKLRDLLAVYSFNLGTSRNAIITAAITRYLKDNLTSREVILEHINAIELLEDKKIGFDQTVVSIPAQIQCKKEITEVLKKEEIEEDLDEIILVREGEYVPSTEVLLATFNQLKAEEKNTQVEIPIPIAPVKKEKKPKKEKVLVEHSIPIVSEKEEDIILDDLDFSDLDK